MIVGLVGFIGSGKDTAASFLIEKGFEKDSFANSLKDACSAIFGWPREMLEGDTVESRTYRENIDYFWSEHLGYKVTPRYILQFLGTDILRNKFYKEIWVASLERRMQLSGKNVVISDVRFPNEIEAINRMGGLILRIKRGPEPTWYDLAIACFRKNCYNDLNEKFPDVHASEYSWVGHPNITAEIDNNGSLKELRDAIYGRISHSL